MSLQSQFTHRQAKGFTIIELMIVVVIIALLVALAVPAYKNYAVRTKVAECINGAAIAKLHVSEYRQIMGPWPPALQDAGLGGNSGSSQFCTGFTDYASDGSFAVDVNEVTIGILTGIVEPKLTPDQLPSGIVNWDCSIGNTSPANIRLLPASCRDS